MAFSGIVGGVTFWGSLVAFGKLQGILPGNPMLFKGQHVLNALLVLGSIAVVVAHAIRLGPF